jgi:FKBP-type peptidyl-prolyl cis-trans isomerase
MMSKIKIPVVLALVACVMFSCAQEKEESSDDIQRKILDAYVSLYYPQAQTMPDGLVYIDKVAGTGTALEKYNAAYVDIVTKTLDGNYGEYTDPEIAKRLGTYSKANFYGPKLFEVGYGSTYIGLETVLTGMKEGGEATFIMPPWLTGTEYASSSQSVSISMIYTVKLKTVIKDIIKYQMDTMASYAKIHYPNLDTLSKGFYFKSLYAGGKDTIASDATVNVRYVGRLLNGFIFDTNIADTAKKYGIYDAAKSYEPLEITYSETAATMSEANSTKIGFCMGLKQMKNYKQEAFTMFYSEFGYGATGEGGQNAKIGPYQPLIFWLQTESKVTN